MRLEASAEPCGKLASSAFEHLEACVQSYLGSRVRHLRLSARHNGLVLHGLARTYYAKQLAQHAVMQSTNLPLVANEIEVV